MEAMGRYDFDASSPTELSFRKGDILKILSSSDPWCMAEMHGQEGFVPQNYLDIQIPSWFQENTSRSFAEEDLINKAVGHFLIRGCQSSPGDFSISVRHEHDVQHFKVIKDNMGHYFLWSDKFSSFNKLVDFYKSHSISKQKLIFLNDGTEDSNPATSHMNAGVAALGQSNQFETAGRRSPVVAMAPAAVHQVKATPIQMRGAPRQGGDGGRGRGRGGRGGSVMLRADPAQARVPSMQVKGSPTQARGSPTQGRRSPVQVSGYPLQVRALYNFKVEEADELGFCAGDVIEVLDCSSTSWWSGRLRGKCGLFPANYTTPL